jgi:hypothetical protein
VRIALAQVTKIKHSIDLGIRSLLVSILNSCRIRLVSYNDEKVELPIAVSLLDVVLVKATVLL